ncbi:hypothetical protein FRC20_012086 [Serendipita sp. 405]|nr:hypothetical protein FRC20_012086 [Serendipita sp. 405]
MSYSSITSAKYECRTEGDLKFTPECAHAIILNSLQRDVTLDFLRQAPLLTAFSGPVTGLWNGKESKMQENFRRLTHLAIRKLRPIATEIILHLPCLKFLDMGLQFEGPSEGVLSNIEGWSFPKLTSLRLGGSVNVADHEKLVVFSHNHSSNLRNLIVEYSLILENSHQGSHIDRYPLHHFPLLQVLGISAHNRNNQIKNFELGESGDTQDRLSLLLTEIDALWSQRNDQITTIGQQCIALLTTPRSMFDKLIMSYSWSQLLDRWQAEVRYSKENKGRVFSAGMTVSSFPPIFSFFAEIYRADVVFLDRDGVDLRGEDGGRFLEQLQRIGNVTANLHLRSGGDKQAQM